MALDDELSAVETVSYRFGRCVAERKDIENAIDTEQLPNGEGNFSIKVDIETSEDSVRVQIDLEADSIFSKVKVLTAATWTLNENFPDEEETRAQFAQLHGIPRCLAATEAKMASLCKEIDVPVPVFPFELDIALITNNLRPSER